MRFLAPWFLLFVAACSAEPATPHGFQPSQVIELAALPAGYRAGTSLRATCTKLRSLAFEDTALDDVDCNTERLSRTLRADAGQLSARFIVSKRCHGRSGAGSMLTCSAHIAVPGAQVGLASPTAEIEKGPAPSAAEVLDLDEPRPQNARQIRVGFAPSSLSRRQALTPRNYDVVAETHVPSVGRALLGQVSARCDACGAEALRHALRVTAGRVGAGEVTSVACFRDDGSERCIGTALEPWSS
jgi:hypothetical protein